MSRTLHHQMIQPVDQVVKLSIGIYLGFCVVKAPD